MELNEFLGLVKRKKVTILSLVVLFLLIGVIFTAVQPFKYGTKSKLLIVQSYDGVVDPYTASRSNEYLSNILASVVTSESFFYEALGFGYRIDQGYFPARPDKRLKEWSKTVSADAINDTGIIAVNVFHKDKYQAEQIAEAVNYILKTKNGLYHGGGDKVSVKVIDPPIVSRFPIKPNVILNLALAFALGFIFSLCYIYLLPEEKYDLRLMPKWRVSEKNESEKDEDNVFNDFEESWDGVDNPLAAKELEGVKENMDKNSPYPPLIKGAESEEKWSGQNNNNEMDLEQEDEFDIAKRGDIRNIF